MHHQSPGTSGDFYTYGNLPSVSSIQRIPPSPAEFNHANSSMDGGYQMESELPPINHSNPHPYPQQQINSFPGSPLTIQTNLPPIQMTAMTQFKINHWQNKNFDSGVQTMSHSQVPSVMSMGSVHPPSMMSGVSSMADELARTELTDQQQQRFENIPLGYRQDSSKALSAMPSLVQLMRDTDEVVVQKAVGIVQNIARQDDDERRTPPVIRGREVPETLRSVMIHWKNKPMIVRMCLGTLFHLCSRSQDQETLQEIIRLTKENNWSFLTDLITFIGREENACWRYATLILHSIVSEKNIGIEALLQARKLNALVAVSSRLAPNNSEKLLSVVVELCRLLCDKDVDLKHKFLELGGIQKLLSVLNGCQYENLLWRTTQLLNHFANYEPGWLVGCGAHKTLCRMLTHGSPRVVNSALECLRNISDVSCEDSDCFPLLSTLLRFMGNENLKTVLYAVQIMGNMCANNKARKEHLIQMNGVGLLIRQICVPSSNPPLEEECHREILDLLRSLSMGHDRVQEVQLMLFENPEIYLHKLMQLRPAVLKKTLQVLMQAAKNDANLERFSATALANPQTRARISFPSLIIYVLYISCEHLPENQMIENVSIPDLIHFSMATLQQLCRDRNLLNEISMLLGQPNHLLSGTILPVYALLQPQIREESVTRSALGLLSSIAIIPELTASFSSNLQLIKTITQHKASQNQTIASYANRALTLIQQGVEQMKSNSTQNYPIEQPRSSGTLRKSSSRPLEDLQQYVSTHQPSPQSSSRAELAEYIEPVPSLEMARNAPSREPENSPDQSPADNWPADLNDVQDTLNPFVNVFCGNDPSPSYQQPMPSEYHGDPKMDMSGQYDGNNWTGYQNNAPNYYPRQHYPNPHQPTQYPNQMGYYEEYRYAPGSQNDYRQRPPVPTQNQRQNYSNYPPQYPQQMPYDDRRYPPY
ncbi:unnamed protein product, partial [Mesorhabditis belari]|uniref:Beta-catenin n=1 Tax=Mesorhabditis belari TaxID=2138241 RepID=A0AAF3FNM6_9BILA